MCRILPDVYFFVLLKPFVYFLHHFSFVWWLIIDIVLFFEASNLAKTDDASGEDWNFLEAFSPVFQLCVYSRVLKTPVFLQHGCFSSLHC